MELLQLIIFKEEQQLQLQKTAFNEAQLQLSQYMSALCWTALVVNVHMKWSYCLKDLKPVQKKNRAIFFRPV